MGSVVVNWRGGTSHAPQRNELLGYLERLALQHERRWGDPPPQRPAFLELLTAQRSENIPAEPRIRRFAGELTGNVLVGSDVPADRNAVLAQALERGIRVTPPEPGAEGFLLHFARIEAHGLDFQLFDPRQIYPGEDRVSFVFLSCAELPALDGRLVLVAGKELCALYGDEIVKRADWYLSAPTVHLRYLFESWFDLFLSWVKYFFLPDLTCWRYEDLSGYEAFVTELEKNGPPSSQRREDLKQRVFELLLTGADNETEEWIAKMATW